MSIEKNLSGWSKANNGLKQVAIITIGLSLATVVGMFFYFTVEVNNLNEKLDKARTEKFILDPSSGLMLRGSFRDYNRRDRENIYKALSRRFVDSWFGFDAETYQENWRMGSHYSSIEIRNRFISNYGKNGKNIPYEMKYNNMQWYSYVDSVKIDMESKPVYGQIYFKRKVKKPAGQKWDLMVGEFEIRDLDRATEENEYAAIIERWRIKSRKSKTNNEYKELVK